MFNNKFYDDYIPTINSYTNLNENFNDMNQNNNFNDMNQNNNFNDMNQNNNFNNMNQNQQNNQLSLNINNQISKINRIDYPECPNNLLDINKLHKEIEKREERKYRVYQKILNKVHIRIITVNKKSNDCYCFFVIPTVIFGVPMYNVENCVIFIMKDLTSRGFQVEYTHPNLLYINWSEKPTLNKTNREEEFKIINDIPDNSFIYHPSDLKNLEEKSGLFFDS